MSGSFSKWLIRRKIHKYTLGLWYQEKKKYTFMANTYYSLLKNSD